MHQTTIVTEAELDEKIERYVEWLDYVFPNWRYDLADCCLGCSTYLPQEIIQSVLTSLDNAMYLRGEGSYRRFILGRQ